MRQIGLIFSALFMTAALTLSLSPAAVSPSRPLQATHGVPIPYGCVANCSPGGGGNTYCQGVFGCGTGAVCLSNENGGGHCVAGNGGQR